MFSGTRFFSSITILFVHFNSSFSNNLDILVNDKICLYTSIWLYHIYCFSCLLQHFYFSCSRCTNFNLNAAFNKWVKLIVSFLCSFFSTSPVIKPNFGFFLCWYFYIFICFFCVQLTLFYCILLLLYIAYLSNHHLA